GGGRVEYPSIEGAAGGPTPSLAPPLAPSRKVAPRQAGLPLYFADGSYISRTARRQNRGLSALAGALSQERMAFGRADGSTISRTARRRHIGGVGRVGESLANYGSLRDRRRSVREGEEPPCGGMTRRSRRSLIRPILGT